jgi:N-acyl-D-amino-acid deacylase
MFDILIKGGKVVDGSGNPWFYADVAIAGDRIVEIGPGLAGRARRTLSAEGKVVCPGFIDMHSHSDLWAMVTPTLEPKVLMGVTTEVVGQDGLSVAPVSADTALRQLVAGLQGDVTEWNWNSYGEYLARLEEARPSTNIVGLVGHASIRLEVMGEEDRLAADDDLRAMQRAIAQAIAEGANGFSTGLIYFPACYADERELTELCRSTAQAGGTIMAVHMRNETDALQRSVEEVLRIGSASGLPMHISHLKVVGRENWGASEAVLATLDEARQRGVQVTYEQYPYMAACTTLHSLLPPWVKEGGPEQTMARLRDRQTRERIKADMGVKSPDWQNRLYFVGWENVFVSAVRTDKNRALEGKAMPQIAASWGKEVYDAFFDLLLEEELAVTMVYHYGSEEDGRRIMSHPLHTVGSDGILGGKTHPRAYGTFPRVLGRYVREEKLLPLEEAIRHMTWAPARILRLPRRGLLLPGMFADVVVFDPLTIIDRATYENPLQYPEGIDYVLVNGAVTAEHGEHTAARQGMILRCESATS